MQQMDLIDDNQSDKLSVGLLSALSGDDIPFLWSGYYQLSALYLLLSKLHVSSQFPHLNVQTFQSSFKITDHFSDQSLHWGDVDHFEFGFIYGSVALTEIAYCLKHSH